MKDKDFQEIRKAVRENNPQRGEMLGEFTARVKAYEKQQQELLKIKAERKTEGLTND